MRVGDYAYVPEPGSIRANIVAKVYPVLRGVAKVIFQVVLIIAFAVVLFALVAEQVFEVSGENVLLVVHWLIIAVCAVALLWLFCDLRIRYAISNRLIAPDHYLLRAALNRAMLAAGEQIGNIPQKESKAMLFRIFFHEEVYEAMRLIMRGEPREIFKADDKIDHLAYAEVMEFLERKRNSTSV